MGNALNVNVPVPEHVPGHVHGHVRVHVHEQLRGWWADWVGMKVPYLDHENLDVYRCSIELLVVVRRLSGEFPRGEGELRDQLKRASISIPLNIAESCGKTTTPDRARFLVIARGSALECGAILDIAAAGGFLTADTVQPAKTLLARIVAMLTKMTR